MKWLDRADQLNFPAKFVITFVCLVFGLATTLATLAPSSPRHRRFGSGYSPRHSSDAPASRSALALPTASLDEFGLRTTTLLPNGEMAGLFADEEGIQFRQTEDETVWRDKSRISTGIALNNLHFVDATHGWAYNGDKYLYRTVDGGASWRKVQLPVDLLIDDMAWVSPQVGFIAGSLYSDDGRITAVKVLRTKDGGRTWRVAGGFASDLAARKLLTPTKDNLLMNVGGKLYVSDDGGASWDETFYESGDIQDLTCDENGDGWIIGEYGRFYRLHIFGADYDNIQPIGMPRDKRWRAIDINAEGLGLALAEGRVVAITKNGGATWQEAELALTETDQVSLIKNLNRVQVRGNAALVSDGNQTFRVDLSAFMVRNVAPPDVKAVPMDSVDDVPPPPARIEARPVGTR